VKVVSRFDLQPTLVGETISLRPLITDDFEALYAAASDPLIWEQHPEPLRFQRQVFEGFFADALASGGALLVTDKTSGEVIGTSRYYEWNPNQREVAIGYTFLVRSHWGGPTNREMKQLMLNLTTPSAGPKSSGFTLAKTTGVREGQWRRLAESYPMRRVENTTESCTTMFFSRSKRRSNGSVLMWNHRRFKARGTSYSAPSGDRSLFRATSLAAWTRLRRLKKLHDVSAWVFD
jgi:hypothetical protein